jgi:hypothetical protein
MIHISIAAEKRSKKIAEKQIDQTWKKRLTAAADPYEVSLQKKKVGPPPSFSSPTHPFPSGRQFLIM